MTTAIIVQARTNSTRLPGKVLLPILGEPMLSFLLERLEWARIVYGYTETIVAVPNDEQRELPGVAYERNWRVWFGPELDVLDRYHGAAQWVHADTIVRVTADCPLIDPDIVTASIAYLRSGGYDHVAAEGLPDGMGLDVMTFDTLRRMHYEATDLLDREHVTLYAIRRPDQFKLGKLWWDTGSPSWRRIPEGQNERLTVDTQADYEKVRAIFEALYPANPRFTLPDILSFLDAHPEIAGLNRDVQRSIFDTSPVPWSRG